MGRLLGRTVGRLLWRAVGRLLGWAVGRRVLGRFLICLTLMLYYSLLVKLVSMCIHRIICL